MSYTPSIKTVLLEGAGCALPPAHRDLLKEHQSKQNERKERQRRQETITPATCLTEVLVDHLNVGVAQANRSQRKLDHKVKTL